jgi:lysophospholipase L1-like esterase
VHLQNLLRFFGVSALLLARVPAADAPSPIAALPIPAFQTGTRVLFQGDSITDGNRGRSADPNHILGHGYVFVIAARHGAAFPERNLTFLNRGISGNTVGDLAKRWTPDTMELRPDLLSILIGINDSARGEALESYEQDYDRLLATVREANPNIRLVLCTPFILPVGKQKEGFEKRLTNVRQREEIVTRLASKHGAALVRFQPVFEAACARAAAEYWMWDGIHPTYSGHQLMADEWERVVRAFWPAP